jgi:hypothetical protein
MRCAEYINSVTSVFSMALNTHFLPLFQKLGQNESMEAAVLFENKNPVKPVGFSAMSWGAPKTYTIIAHGSGLWAHKTKV